jgi:hypothetical protein
MNIPRFWATASGEAERSGRSMAFRILGWSHASIGEAQAMARDRLVRVLDRVRRGEDLPHGYGYGDRPVREEIVREVGDGLVTRNRYGALVLNAPRALFIDVDVPRAPRVGLVARLFGRRGPDPADAVLERVRNALRGVAGASFRIYRTKAGFRVLATDPLFDPDSPRARQLFEAAGADPWFVRLCGVQKSFRARLTPKPERCGTWRPEMAYPRETAAEQQAFATWLARYESLSARFAVCKLVETVGPARVHAEIAPLLAIHDAETKVASDLPLA